MRKKNVVVRELRSHVVVINISHNALQQHTPPLTCSVRMPKPAAHEANEAHIWLCGAMRCVCVCVRVFGSARALAHRCDLLLWRCLRRVPFSWFHHFRPLAPRTAARSAAALLHAHPQQTSRACTVAATARDHRRVVHSHTHIHTRRDARTENRFRYVHNNISTESLCVCVCVLRMCAHRRTDGQRRPP